MGAARPRTGFVHDVGAVRPWLTLSAHPQLSAPTAPSTELAEINQAANAWPVMLEQRRGGQKKTLRQSKRERDVLNDFVIWSKGQWGAKHEGWRGG